MVQAPPQTPTLSLQVPQGLSLHVTSEQFATLAGANHDLRLERTAIGELIIKPLTGGITGIQNAHITGQLGAWLETSNLGVAFASSTGFELPNHAIRSPDASWLPQVRWDALTQEQKEGFAPLCPDFVLELLSDTDTLEEVRAKMTEYIENGARLGWLIDPKNKRVEVYRPGQEVEILEHPRTLSGEAVLPGFTLSLQRIWA